MSVSVYVNAIKEITPEQESLITAYNALIAADLTVPDDLYNALEKILGEDNYELQDGIEVKAWPAFVEIPVKGVGEVEYGGMKLPLDSLPEGTKSLRVYME